MWDKKPSGRASYARIEYRSVQATVEQKLAEGYSIKLIYEELTGAGLVTMGYTSFCDYIRGKGERRHSTKKDVHKRSQTQVPNKPASPQAASRKSGPVDKSEPFKVERYSLDELI